MFSERFTQSQANRMLPLLSRIVEDLLESQTALEQARLFGPVGNPFYRRLRSKLDSFHAEIEALGCHFTASSIRHGVVEIPGIQEGKIGDFLWSIQEPQVSRFRVEESFLSRINTPA